MPHGWRRDIAALIILAAGGCKDISPEIPDRNFTLIASGSRLDPVTGRRASCAFRVSVERFTYGEDPWTDVTEPGGVNVWRSISNQDGSNMTFVTSSSYALGINITFPTPDSVLVILTGSFADTLRTGRGYHAAAPYGGTWNCPGTLPLGTDSALVANGYDGSLPMTGSWTLAAFRPAPD